MNVIDLSAQMDKKEKDSADKDTPKDEILRTLQDILAERENIRDILVIGRLKDGRVVLSWTFGNLMEMLGVISFADAVVKETTNKEEEE